MSWVADDLPAMDALGNAAEPMTAPPVEHTRAETASADANARARERRQTDAHGPGFAVIFAFAPGL
jgi:hypothetical protein